MIVQIEYDANGDIRAVAGAGSLAFPDGTEGKVGRIPGADYNIVDLEAKEIQHDRDFAGLKKVMETYRVTGHPHKPRLTPK
jgi:hypothetical protein